MGHAYTPLVINIAIPPAITVPTNQANAQMRESTTLLVVNAEIIQNPRNTPPKNINTKWSEGNWLLGDNTLKAMTMDANSELARTKYVVPGLRSFLTNL